jgi:hypothetical protein
VEVLINPTAELESNRPCGRREVFPLDETDQGDGKNMSHIFATRILKEILCYS